ncbi:MAG: hypothetical protein Phyf2KO_17270 [Phycisphaerales bacterium]
MCILVFCLGGIALAEPALKDEIESTLDAMAASALAADREGYLEHIWDGEKTLHQEHWAWAKDLERITPDVLKFEIVGDPEIVDGEAFADIKITWNTENWESHDRTIDVPVRFIDDNGRWLYAGRQWTELKGDGVRVLYAEGLGESAVRALDIWPDIKQKVEEGFNRTLDHPQVIKMYTSMPELQFSIFPAYVEPLGGWNEPMESIKLVGFDFSEGHLRAVLGHEYAHALTFSIPPEEIAVERAHAVPWWVHEGIAELATQGFTPNRGRSQMAVEHWHRKGELQAWEDLTDFYTVDPAHYGQVYVQGRHMVSYVNDTFGTDARVEWIESMMMGASLEEASEQSLGKAWSEVDADWRAMVAADVEERDRARAEEEAKKKAAEQSSTEGSKKESADASKGD